MVTRESLKKYVDTFNDETRATLIETMELYEDRLNQIIEEKNSKLLVSSLTEGMFFNEYFVIVELMKLRTNDDLNNWRFSFEQLKKDSRHNE